MKVPIYRGIAVPNLETLAEIQGITVAELGKLIDGAPNYYQAHAPIIKSDGRKRQIYTVMPPLKLFQDRVVRAIFHRVEFPTYLQGSIKANGTRRGYIENASMHANYRVTVSDDIRDFFPSIGYDLVFKIWRDFFDFPNQVACALTRATTYKGRVPQGASTSSYIANLVFWDIEGQLESTLEQYRFFYTRFIDDINVSCNKQLTETVLGFVTEKVYGMLYSKGFRPNREKRRIQTGSKKKTIHGLNIGKGSVTMDNKERSKIRAAVKQCEKMAKISRSSEEYAKAFASTFGRVTNMQRLHPHEAQPYRDRLSAIKPTNS